MFAAILTKLKLLFQNPMVLFIYGIISQWYIMVVVTAVMVAYWVLHGLSGTGILEEAKKVVSKAFIETKSVAQHCTPKILTLGDFWDCLNNPPIYKQSKDEQNFENGLNDLLDFSNYNEETDPYEQNLKTE